MNAPTIPTSSLARSDAGDWLEQHGDYLFNFAIGQVRNSATAEDLVQETLLAALKGQDRFHARSSERTWLVGILRHKVCDHLRRAARERCVHFGDCACAGEDPDDAMLWTHEMAEECVSPCRRMELSEFREQLETALGRLPPRLAQVFQLHEIEERPHSEICRTLAISESNLWVMLHRARKQLRTQLAAWWSRDIKDEPSKP